MKPSKLIPHFNEYLTAMAFQDGLQGKNKMNKENVFFAFKTILSFFLLWIFNEFIDLSRNIKNMPLFSVGKTAKYHGLVTQRLSRDSF